MRSLIRKTLQNQFSTTARAPQQIGFVGLGNMGSGMVKNLQKSENFEVTAFDVMPETREKLRSEGINVVEDIQEIVKNENINQIVLMLPAAQHVKGLCLGENGLFNSWRDGCQIIDCSTIGPGPALELFKASEGTGVEFVDAPVSGGVNAAANGVLTFMVGSNTREQFSQVEPALQAMGKNVFDCEKPSGGQITKAANNMALAIQMMSIAEALTLGKKLGMDPKVLSKVMNTASSQCWSLSLYNPCPGVLEGVPSGNDWEGGFASELMLKDLGISREAAASIGASIPLGNHAQEVYQEVVEQGFARKDFGVVYDLLEKNKI